MTLLPYTKFRDSTPVHAAVPRARSRGGVPAPGPSLILTCKFNVRPFNDIGGSVFTKEHGWSLTHSKVLTKCVVKDSKEHANDESVTHIHPGYEKVSCTDAVAAAATAAASPGRAIFCRLLPLRAVV